MPKIGKTNVIPAPGKKGSVGHRGTSPKRTTRTGAAPTPTKGKGY